MERETNNAIDLIGSKSQWSLNLDGDQALQQLNQKKY